MLSRAETGKGMDAPGRVMRSILRGLQWGLDRTVSVGYGVVYDYIFEQFEPYQALQREVLTRVEASVPEGAQRRDVRVLEVGCGPGNFSCILAEAGFSVVGIDPYGGLIELAREKRRAKRLSNLAFQHADLALGNTFWEGAFDQIVSIHSLYAHPEPRRMLAEACRILRPGGHAIFVNHTRRIGLVSTFRDVTRRAPPCSGRARTAWGRPPAPTLPPPSGGGPRRTRCCWTRWRRTWGARAGLDRPGALSGSSTSPAARARWRPGWPATTTPSSPSTRWSTSSRWRGGATGRRGTSPSTTWTWRATPSPARGASTPW